MNEHIREIVGKTISGVVVKENRRGGQPRSQAFLIFSDNTYFEFYSSFEKLSWTKGVSGGGLETVRRYAGKFETVLEVTAGGDG